MKRVASLALFACAFAALPASAQFARSEDAVKYRQSALTVMGTHFYRIGAMASGRAPYDAKAALDNAQVVADMARLPWAGFGPGTDKISPKAKPEIWTEQAKFKDLSEKMAAETVNLLAAAKTNNLDNLKKAFASTNAACKACHDTYRGN